VQIRVLIQALPLMGYGFTHLGADVEELDGEELIESSLSARPRWRRY
jgi:hypothetical protein